MLAIFDSILNDTQISQIRQRLDALNFVDGKPTALGYATTVKNNLQADPAEESTIQLRQQLLNALKQSPDFVNFAHPLKFYPPRLARYTAGMYYGQHLDAPTMLINKKPLRTDLSVTLFLNNPDEYEGGELVIETTGGDEVIKLPAGSLVVYESNTLHEVTEVTSGERVVAVCWLQSIIRYPEIRHILYDMWKVGEVLRQLSPEADETLRQTRAFNALFRHFAEM